MQKARSLLGVYSVTICANTEKQIVCYYDSLLKVKSDLGQTDEQFAFAGQYYLIRHFQCFDLAKAFLGKFLS